MLLTLLFIGCSNNSTTRSAEPTPEPTPPVYVEVPAPVEPVIPDPSSPDVGTGSVNYNPSCQSGFAKIIYVFRSDSTIDTNSFVITHVVDGNNQDIKNGTVYGNGSISKMEENIYVSPNDTDRQKVHQIQVSFLSDGLSQINSFAFIQPACEVIVPEDDPEEPEEDPEVPEDEPEEPEDANVTLSIVIE